MIDPFEHQRPSPDFIGAAAAIREAYERLGEPEWFGAWLDRVARDIRINPPNIGEAKGRA